MSILELGSLQLTLFAMMLIGALLKKKDIIDENGKKCLADLCINVVIPCNIFKSCLIELDAGVLKSCAMLFVSAVVMQLLCLALNRFLFERYDAQRKKVLQYRTIVPMSGFLGNPIAEGIYNEVGVLYTSIFLIPMRIVMWSVGTTYFVAGETVEKRKVIKNVLTHPCLVAIYLGLLCMVTQVQLPSVILNTVKYIVSRDTVKFSLLRLALLPAAALGVGLLLHLEPAALGVSVLMTGMPAGATAVIFAAKYGSDAPFAARNVVFTTLLSMLTLPLWAYAVG